jgi:FkbM family methyltransferase
MPDPETDYFEHLQKTFTLEHLPANVRASRFMGRWPFLRRYKGFPIGLNFFPSEGRFTYQRQGQQHQVKFNGRNLQFHALYENYNRRGYELETSLLIAQLCRGQSSFFDIGSNWGYFSLLAASLPGFKGPIYAFEPNPGTFADLTQTLQQAGLQDRIEACNLGVGRTACELVIDEPDRFNTGLSRLTTSGTGQRIPVKPLDDLKFPTPGVIKIDAEGMELEVLAGASKTLTEGKPFIIFENFLNFTSPKSTYETMSFLAQKDYRLFVPALEFSVAGTSVLATYGRDYCSLVQQGGPPRLGVVETSGKLRFMLGDHLNLLAVPASRLEEFWSLGISDWGKI